MTILIRRLGGGLQDQRIRVAEMVQATPSWARNAFGTLNTVLAERIWPPASEAVRDHERMPVDAVK